MITLDTTISTVKNRFHTKGACTNHVDKRGGKGGCLDDHNTL